MKLRSGIESNYYKKCPECDGTGKDFRGMRCQDCDGSGEVHV
jgi:DnaJ-class molecular chaperone